MRARGGEKIPHTRRTRGVSGVAKGDIAGLGRDAGHTRIAQGRRVGGLEPKLRSSALPGCSRPVFGLVESAKNAPPRSHEAMASTRHARRGHGRPAPRARLRACKCTCTCYMCMCMCMCMCM
eukprot:scaffold37559_cov66-Phaeocystis_antarctica.AAC.6